MKAYVYQAKNPSFDPHRDGQRVSLLDLHERYDCMAVVSFTEAEAIKGVDHMLDECYEKTNHIHHAWWENEGVEVRKQGRSTSVGDVVVLEFANGGEGIYGCANVGWSKLRF